jgi:hypothetical protein
VYAGSHVPGGLVDADVNLLTIDLGGNDVYTDGAGAAYPLSSCMRYIYDDNLHRVRQGGPLPDPSQPRLGLCGNGLPAAASIDLAGDDDYESHVTVHDDQHHAAQGAAFYGGLGVLVDMAGNDTYNASMAQTDGTYIAYQSVQGAGGAISYSALGILLDAGGDDTFAAREQLAPAVMPSYYYGQQRAQGGDDGFLFDLGGNDAFTVEQRGPQQSWQTVQGFVGMLLKTGGDDRYTLVQETADASYQLGTGGDGILVDTAGDDAYQAVQRCPAQCNWQDVQGSAEPAGFGVLADLQGRDTYHALAVDAVAQRAQGACFGAQCALLDLEGDDAYTAESAGPLQVAQGAQSMESVQFGAGALFDGGGNDAYRIVHNGPGVVYGQGAAQNGAALGALVDAGGDDSYALEAPGLPLSLAWVQGASDGSTGLLLDLGGHDAYSDAAAHDGTAWLQGTGLGVDAP